MAQSGYCIYTPKINDEPSEMYMDLLTMYIDRPLVNYVYAKYLASDAATKMDALGYKRNDQDQHSAADVYKYFNLSALQRERGFSIEHIESKYGIVEKNGERVRFSPVDAYMKASEINQDEAAYAAKVVKRGDTFTVIADRLDSRTQIWKRDVERDIVGFQAAKNAFQGTNVDFDALQAEFPEMVNPMDIGSFFTYMGNEGMRKASIDNLSEKDIRLLLITGKGSPHLDSMMQRGWGTPEEIAAKAYDILHNSANYSQDVVSLVRKALTEARTANIVAFDKAVQRMTQEATRVSQASEETSIEATLQNLDRLYDIGHAVIMRTDKTIRTLTDAGAEAILTLERQLRYLQKQEGRVGEGLAIERTLDELSRNIASKKYYVGLLQFLQEANTYAVKVSNLLRNVPTSGTAMERSFAMGKALSKAITFRDGYNVIVQALRNPEVLLIDENMTDDELSALGDLAKTIGSMLDRQKADILAMQQDLATTVAQEVLGSDAINGVPIAQIVQMGTADSSLLDFLYSCERVSDPIISSMGTVIRDAQRKRDRIASEFAARIEMAHRALIDAQKKDPKVKRKDRGDTSFMYESFDEWAIDWDSYNQAAAAEKERIKALGLKGADAKNAFNKWWLENTEDVGGHKRLPNDDYKYVKEKFYVLSNYDWGKYNEEKRKYERFLKSLDITGFKYNDLVEKWIDENTVEVVVDEKSGRTERVPNDNYQNTGETALNRLSEAQREYYDTMMQIKGEIGTLLPSYAQKQFLPPQRRASWLDIVTQAKRRGLTAKDVAKNILRRMNPLIQKEDDTAFVEGGIIGDPDMDKTYSSYDDTILRQVPIYYVNRLRDQKDLLWDFSGAVEGLGAVAANYAVLNGSQERTAGANDGIVGVKEVVENMADYLKQRPIVDRDANGRKRIDIVKWDQVLVGKVLRKFSERTLTSFLIDGFVNKHIYNQQLALGEEGSAMRKVQLAVRALLGYTSVAALSVNVKGAVSNYLVGEYQMLFESLSGSLQKRFVKGHSSDNPEFYTLRDYARADMIMFGHGATGKGVVMDHLANTTGTLASLLERRFDPLQEVYTDLGEKRYYSGLKKLIGGFNWMGMYSAGESLIHLHNMYAVLSHEKVKFNGKTVSLYDVFDREVSEDGKNATLIIKQGATMTDGRTPITEEYLEKVQAKIRLINQKTHGSMNSEDKGAIHMAMAGRAVMQFKQWMVEHYSRRFRGSYFDGTTRTWQEGYYTTVYKMMKGWVSDLFKMNLEGTARWNQLDQTQKNNVTRAISELVCFAGLLMLAQAMGDPKEHKGEGLYRFLIYQLRRLIMDEEASMPITPLFVAGGVAKGGESLAKAFGADIESDFYTSGGIYKEGMTLMQTPFAFTKTVNGLLYPITGLGEITDKYQKGRNKDKNKYWTKIKKNTLPFYGQIDQLLHMDTEDYIFNVFDNVAYNKGK